MESPPLNGGLLVCGNGESVQIHVLLKQYEKNNTVEVAQRCLVLHIVCWLLHFSCVFKQFKTCTVINYRIPYFVKFSIEMINFQMDLFPDIIICRIEK